MRNIVLCVPFKGTFNVGASDPSSVILTRIQQRLPDRRDIVAYERPPLSFINAASDATDIDVVRPDRNHDINVSCARTGFAH
jgi:hypothetical protein